MPTTTSPPILIWQPGGGTPIGPVSNPPVYSQADVTQLVQGQAYIDIVFGAVQTSEDWVLVACEVENTVDFEPLNIWPGIITDKTVAGFRLQLNGMPDTGNYYLRWAVSGVNVPPSPATTYLFTGPIVGGFGVPSTFTVRLSPSTTVSGILTVTPNDGGAGGVFSPVSVTISSSDASATFTYTPALYGAITLGVANSGILVDPANIVFTSVVSTYTLTGPSSGDPLVASSNFTVALPLGGLVTGTITVTPNDGGDGGTFIPATVGLTTGAPSATFTYTPASVGVKTISATNNRGLINPANLTYTAALTPHLLNTLISYWKLDEASGTRNDSQGTNHLTANNAPAGVTGKINNGAQFVSASSQYLSRASNSSLQVTSDFTFSLWVKLTTQINSTILAKDAGTGLEDYSLNYDTTAGFYFFLSGPLSVDAQVAHVAGVTANGVWSHLVIWYDSGTGQVYGRVNDSATAQSTGSLPLAQTTSQFTIGSTGNPANYSNCVIDEVGFWKRKLTSLEITALYNAGTGLPYSSFTT
jgi:hypothetical protein